MLREALLKIHLYAGLAAGTILFVVGLTGGILAFDGYYDRWLHPSLWRVTPQGAPMNESALIGKIQSRFAQDKIQAIEMGGRDSSQVFTTTARRTIFVNPYSGDILGERRKSEVGAILGTVRRVHTRLGGGATGRSIVDYATMATLFLIPSGLYLWWKKKTWTIAWGRSWRRVNWDLHSVIGAYSLAFLTVLAVTGFFLASEDSLFWVVRSGPQPVARRARSTAPVGASAQIADIGASKAMASADAIFPALPTARIRFPDTDTDPYVIEKRSPMWIAGTAPSAVFVDRYSGRVLRVDDARQFTRGYKAYRINLALHTGTFAALPSAALLAPASFLLPALAISGFLIWLSKRPGKSVRAASLDPRNELASKF